MYRKKVLIADDELYIGQLVKRALGTDYTVLAANNGEEAVELACSQKPDIILMDILMPKLDGYSACYQIKRDEATRAIPVVMLTGIGHDLNKKLAEGMGADGYITKPFNAKTLLDTVRKYESAPCVVGA
jgi:two-component system alkaline phosphatase synthesis response regulator PhoP